MSLRGYVGKGVVGRIWIEKGIDLHERGHDKSCENVEFGF